MTAAGADSPRTPRYSFAASERKRAPARSRAVRSLKLLLPITAAALVTLLIAWPQLQWQESDVPPDAYALRPTDADNLSMLNARYVGVDSQNRPFTVTAESTRQAGTDTQRLDLERPQADITLRDGAWVALTAEQGTYDREANTLALSGDVQLFHDLGYQFRSESARVDLKAGAAAGDEPVVAQGPAGVLTGEGFRIENGGRRIVLTGHATVQLNPQALPRTGSKQ